MNAAPPGVVPALQQWSGGTGRMFLTSDSHIVVPSGSPSSLLNLASEVARETRELTMLNLPVVTGTAGAGDITLRIDPNADFGAAKPELRPEAYRLSISTDSIDIVGGSQKGAYYGTRTLLQAIVGSHRPYQYTSLPVGSAVDYPNYAVRGFMLDVGRRYFTPQFIQSYLHWMGWLKLNTLQLHLNDNEIKPPDGDWSKAQSAFRLKSTNPAFAGLAATDGSYSRADWDSFEATAAANSVTIIPEIDSPGHARAFIKFKPELGLDGGNSDHLDLSKPATTDFMKSVFAEFAPWFRGPTVHIGIDEYEASPALYKTYVNTMAPYVRSLGKTVNAWGSFSKMSGGGAGYDKGMVINSWNNNWYGPKAAIADGYKVINSNDGLLYVVPFAGYYHGQGLDGQSIFTSWAPNVFGGGQDLAVQDPNLLGAMPAVWNDLVRTPYTELQVHTLIEKSFNALAQKMWSADAAGPSYATFLDRVTTVGQGPGTAYLPDTLKPNPVPEDLAFGRPVTASSVESPYFPAEYAVDGNETTRWSSARSDNQWLQVDLGSAQRFARVSLRWEEAYGKDYDIQVSNDGTNWTTVAERRGRPYAGDDVLRFPSTTARYVRMKGITRGTAYGYSLYSIKVLKTDNTYYIDCTEGHDDAAGTSPTTAWRSLEKVRNRYFGPGDKVLLRRGVTCQGTLSLTGASGDPGNPVIISDYGTSTSPAKIDGNGATQAIDLVNPEYVELSNLEVTNPVPPTASTDIRRGVHVYVTKPGVARHIVVRDLYIHDILGNDLKEAAGSQGIFFEVWGGTGQPAHFDDVQILRNVLKHVDRQGILVSSGWSYRPEEDSTKSPTLANGQLRPVWTPATGVVVRGNTLDDIGGDGIVMNTTDGAKVEYNTIRGFHMRSAGYSAGVWPYNSNNTLVQYNNVVGGDPRGNHKDGMAYDIDQGNIGAVFQYNYSANNKGGFFLLCQNDNGTIRNAVIRYNISQNDEYRGFENCAGKIESASIYNNTIFIGDGISQTVVNENNTNLRNVKFRNNIVRKVGAGTANFNLKSGGYTFDHNAFSPWVQNVPSNPNGVTADPKFMNPNAATSRVDASGYKLQVGSPALAAGAVIPNNGGQDYYGSPVPSNTAPNIGAYEGPGLQ
ncbi:family 20 glycosylhydrolase [Streptomyces sp.]|uniref:family 20 glycosylhydrolase n=1 Tax=Streptomyces sp. TaxID=1931 RepID=UPI002D78A1B6|nr:family 20 glycosylhydrolase [Streptomyces sp.]HET6355817.1 family 20 glycosylhydrolase [Streptomyces sp.]